MTWFLALSPIVRRALILVAIFCLCVVVGVALCARGAKEDAERAEAGQTMAEGRTGAAQDASGVRDRADARDQQITTTTTETTDAIRKAPDDAAAGDHALGGLCKLYPDRDARCRVLVPDTGRVG